MREPGEGIIFERHIRLNGKKIVHHLKNIFVSICEGALVKKNLGNMVSNAKFFCHKLWTISLWFNSAQNKYSIFFCTNEMYLYRIQLCFPYLINIIFRFDSAFKKIFSFQSWS